MARTPSNPVTGLTERQLQVVTLLALGCSNDEVAERLGISARTAKAHCDVLRQNGGNAGVAPQQMQFASPDRSPELGRTPRPEQPVRGRASAGQAERETPRPGRGSAS